MAKWSRKERQHKHKLMVAALARPTPAFSTILYADGDAVGLHRADDGRTLKTDNLSIVVTTREGEQIFIDLRTSDASGSRAVHTISVIQRAKAGWDKGPSLKLEIPLSNKKILDAFTDALAETLKDE